MSSTSLKVLNSKYRVQCKLYCVSKKQRCKDRLDSTNSLPANSAKTCELVLFYRDVITWNQTLSNTCNTNTCQFKPKQQWLQHYVWFWPQTVVVHCYVNDNSRYNGENAVFHPAVLRKPFSLLANCHSLVTLAIELTCCNSSCLQRVHIFLRFICPCFLPFSVLHPWRAALCEFVTFLSSSSVSSTFSSSLQYNVGCGDLMLYRHLVLSRRKNHKFYQFFIFLFQYVLIIWSLATCNRKAYI